MSKKNVGLALERVPIMNNCMQRTLPQKEQYKTGKEQVNKLLSNAKLEDKIDLLLEQQAATQRAIAHLKADLRTIIKETVTEVVNKHAVQGYSRRSGGQLK